MNLRYAILHHTEWPCHPDHYDLLLQIEPGASDDDRVLVTFSTLTDEFPADGVLFKKNENHRRLFLDYEGPLSSGRGRVIRVDAGICRAEALSNYILSEGRLKGRAILMMLAGGNYVLRLE